MNIIVLCKLIYIFNSYRQFLKQLMTVNCYNGY